MLRTGPSKPALRKLEGPVTSAGLVRSLSEAEGPRPLTLGQTQGERCSRGGWPTAPTKIT